EYFRCARAGVGRSLEWIDDVLERGSVRRLQAVRIRGQPVYHRVSVLRPPPAQARPEASTREPPDPQATRSLAPPAVGAPAQYTYVAGGAATALALGGGEPSRLSSIRHDRPGGAQLRGMDRMAWRLRGVGQDDDRGSVARRLVAARDQPVRIQKWHL